MPAPVHMQLPEQERAEHPDGPLSEVEDARSGVDHDQPCGIHSIKRPHCYADESGVDKSGAGYRIAGPVAPEEDDHYCHPHCRHQHNRVAQGGRQRRSGQNAPHSLRTLPFAGFIRRRGGRSLGRSLLGFRFHQRFLSLLLLFLLRSLSSQSARFHRLCR